MSNDGKSEYFYKTCMEMADDDDDEAFCGSVKDLAKEKADPSHILSEMAKRFDEEEIEKAVKKV